MLSYVEVFREFIMIIVVGGIKGGSGKTTVATNLAIMLASQKRDVLLVDADDQETASDFTAIRNETNPEAPSYTNIKLTGSDVRTQIAKLKDKYQDIVIDTGGRDTTSQRSALIMADTLLIPFVPRSFDVWTIEKVGLLVEEIKEVNTNLQAYSFINRGDTQGADNDSAADILRESKAIMYLDAPLYNRKAYGNAAASGISVTELRPRDSKASAEIETLFEFVVGSALNTESLVSKELVK